jgi:hypothetical protein
MQVKVDQGFLNNILDLFSSDQEASRDQEVTIATLKKHSLQIYASFNTNLDALTYKLVKILM